MNLQEAKVILKKKGYRLLKENLTYTPEDIFEEVWSRCYSYWDDLHAEKHDLRAAFICGYKNELSKNEMKMEFETRVGNEALGELEIAYDDGHDLSEYTTDDSLQDKLFDFTTDDYFNE